MSDAGKSVYIDLKLNNKSCEALDVFGDQIPKVLKISITSQPTTRRSSDSSVEALSSDMV